VSLLREAPEYHGALRVLDEIIERYPDDVCSSISKATLYLYFVEDLKAALTSIDQALQKTSRTGFFRREALGVKARILLQLRRAEASSEVIEEITSLKIVKGVPDIGRERDFIDRAPPGFIPDDVIARYNQFRPKRKADTAANEPPEYEAADDAE